MLIALCLATAPLLQSAPAPATGVDGLILFDGTTLDGWSGDPRFWSVEDGAIVGRSTAEQPCDATTYLVLEGQEFADFDLSLEYRIDGGNSGVQFRSAVVGEWRVAGYQADLEDGPSWTGGIYEQDGRGVMVRRGQAVVTDGPQRRVDALPEAERLEGLGGPRAWHTYRVRAVGPRIELFIDGVPTARLDDTAPAARARGRIALQLHQGPPMEVRFRNLSLRPLGWAPAAAPGASGPRWIWHPEGARDGQLVRLERRVRVAAGLERATLFATCDNGVEVAVDGTPVAAGEDWAAPFEVDVTRWFAAPAEHTITAECWNEAGPAGFLARLTLTYADGRTEEVHTDVRWRVPGGAPALDLAPLGAAPWGIPSRRSSGAIQATIDASELRCPPGFTAERLYTVPRIQGSWAALTVDGRGRIIAAAEARRGLFRLTIREGRVVSVEPLDIDIAGAQGLLAHGRDLYVMRNEWGGGQNGLWRARDADGDDVYDELELLEPLAGGGEHGPHAVRLTPDGTRLQVIAGNATALPADIARSRVLMRWCEDQVLPSLPDTFGHGNTMHLHGGWTATCDLDGNDWELVAVGMRNAYDLAFDASGEALTFDSDMEWDMGLPWYRAPRVLHLFPGAEFGWRRGSGKIPADAPETVGAVCETGPASPVGVLHGRDGGFHPPFDDRLFIGDWTRGRVLAVELTPDRGSYTGEVKPFVSGRPFPVTDMEWLDDGSMVIAIGGRGGRSALYRIASETGPGASGPEEPVVGLVPEGPRADRMRLAALEELVAPGGGSSGVALDLGPIGWLARARAGGKDGQDELLKAIVSSEGRIDRLRLRAIELSVARDGDPSPDVVTRIAERLAAELPGPDPGWNIAAVELLVRFGSPAAQRFAVPAMEAARTQELAIDLALALSWAEAGWTEPLARRYLDFLHGEARAFRGGRSVEGYMDRIRAAALERAAPAIAGDYVPPERPAAAPLPIEATLFVKSWRESDLVPLLDRLPSEPDLAAGERAFRRGRCFTCHRVGEEGEGTGPDLTDAGARFTPRDLLTALVEPSKDVSDQYRDTEVWTADGEVFVGRRVGAEEGWVAVQEANADDAGGSIVEIAEDEIRLVRPSPLSRMPRGLLDTLTEEEITQLLAWVLADKRGGQD